MAPVDNSELLARFVTSSRWFRPGSNTIRPDAFIPYPWPDLSVTRHSGDSEGSLWQIGQKIVDCQIPPKTLYGRADLKAEKVAQAGLQIDPQPEPDNPEHAVILGWPKDKPSQKIRAQQLAAESVFKLKP